MPTKKLFIYLILIVFPLFLSVVLSVGADDRLVPWESDFQENQYDVVQKSEIIFIGNSMLETRLKLKEFTEQIGMRSYMLHFGGMSSAGMYLAFKNFIHDSQKQFRAVCIFTRIPHITFAEYRTTGEMLERLEWYARDEEPVFDRIAYLNGIKGSEYFIRKNYGLYRSRNKIQSGFKDRYLNWVLPIDLDVANEYTKAVLHGENRDANYEEGIEFGILEAIKMNPYDFDLRVERSFLPEIIKLAKDRDIPLVFCLVNKKKYLQNPAQPMDGEEKIYYEKFKNYLNENDVPLIDLTVLLNGVFEPESFHGDHVTEDIDRDLVTQTLVTEIEKLFPIESSN